MFAYYTTAFSRVDTYTVPKVDMYVKGYRGKCRLAWDMCIDSMLYFYFTSIHFCLSFPKETSKLSQID